MAVASPELTAVVDRGISWALSVLHDRFADDDHAENNLAYHNEGHTNWVIEYTAYLLKAMGADERQILIGRYSAACHDLVQKWEQNQTADGKVLRRRFAGNNEAASADDGIAWMAENSHGAFTEEDATTLRTALMATVPGWDPVNFTVLQPNLHPDSDFVIRALALADLGAGGLDSATYSKQGDQLFREENLDISRILATVSSYDEIPEAHRISFRTRLLGWSRTQAGFVTGRKNRLEIELGNLLEESKGVLREMFGDFDESTAKTKAIFERREAMTFAEMAADAGYKLGN